jgi:hypothetical protein
MVTSLSVVRRERNGAQLLWSRSKIIVTSFSAVDDKEEW